MFNGIIFNTGRVKSIKKNKNSILLMIESNHIFKKKEIGTSVCCNGVCLTITKINRNSIFFYISSETIKKTNFKNIKIGQLVNLEKSLVYGQDISGHFTQGHVDTTAKVIKISFIDKSWLLRLKIKNKKFYKFIEEKASISINGVSLTISDVSTNYFDLNIIPHTLKLTSLKNLRVNDVVNVELDIFAKYMYKFNS